MATPTANETTVPGVAPLPTGAAVTDEELESTLQSLPDSHRCRTAGIRVENARHSLAAAFEQVTPATAARWLNDNVHNRHLAPIRATNTAEDMSEGRWQQTGDTIKFDIYGHLLDGQHRLKSLLDSGTTQLLLVVRGLQPSAQQVMDSGARRTAGDALSLLEFVPNLQNGKNTAAMVRRVIEWQAGRRTRNQRIGKNVVTTAAVVEFVQANEAKCRETVELAMSFSSVPISVAVRGLLLWVLTDIDREAALEFFARLNDGAGLEQGNPILTLRNRLMDARVNIPTKGRLQETTILDMSIRAWNAWREGRPLLRLATNTGKGDPGQVTTPR